MEELSFSSLYEQRKFLSQCEKNLRSRGHSQCAVCPHKTEIVHLDSNLADLFGWKEHDNALSTVGK